VIVINVVSMRTVVDVPAPLGPRMPKISPGPTRAARRAHHLHLPATARVLLDELRRFDCP
jgi:hypothetical protein